MPRPKNLNPKKKTHLYLDQNLYDMWKVLLTDPTTGRIKYGALSDLTNRLLREELSRRQKEQRS